MFEKYKIGFGGHPQMVGGCVMEWVSLIARNQLQVREGDIWVDWDRANDVKTDEPSCANPLVTFCAIEVNDSLEQGARDRLLAPLLPRLIRASDPPDIRTARRVSRRLQLWLIDRRLDQFDDELSGEGRALLEALREAVQLGVEETAEGPLVELAGRLWNRYALSGGRWSLADQLVHRHWDASSRSDGLLSAVVAELKIDDPDPEELIALLVDLLDALDKAKAEEGALGDDPEPLYLSEEELEIVVRELSGEG